MNAAPATEMRPSVTTAPRLRGREQRASRHGKHDQVRVTALGRGDAGAVMAMLGRCSAATLYHRFHGVTDGLSHATQLFAGTAGLDAYSAWSADRCVGLASLGVGDDGSAHIGVLVEDRWQRRGVGSALLLALVNRARARGLPSLLADVVTDNQFIVPLLARIGPIATTTGYGSYRVRIGLEQDMAPDQPGHPERTPVINDPRCSWRIGTPAP